MASSSPVHPLPGHHEHEATESPPELQATLLTNDLLGEIFIRIHCPAALIRASTACVFFRCLITDDAFLRRYRSRRQPLLLGFVNFSEISKGLLPIEAPHPNAPAARTLGNVSFAFEHLPPEADLDSWFVNDVRNGRILIACREFGDDEAVPISTEVVVCDPSSLSRRHMALPPVPKDQVHEEDNLDHFDAIFAPYRDEDRDETSFRVIGMMYCQTKLVVFVFDSDSGSWTLGISASWDTLSLSNGPEECPSLKLPSYAYGCIYWHEEEQKKLLKLDIGTMEFSTIDLPPGHEEYGVLPVEAGEGRLGMFSCKINDFRFLNYYHYSCVQNGDKRVDEWQMKNVVQLPVFEKESLHFCGGHQGCIFIQGDTKVEGSVRTMVYSLDMQTFKLEMVTQMNCHFRGHLFFSFPPCLSQRRI